MKLLLSLKFWLTALILILVLTACTDNRKITPEWDYTDHPITLTIHTFDTLTEMQYAVMERTGKEQPSTLQGFAIMSPDDTVCEVFVVKSKRIDDEHTKTLGHEVLHCLYGRYHE